jgi:hypothetical protein
MRRDPSFHEDALINVRTALVRLSLSPSMLSSSFVPRLPLSLSLSRRRALRARYGKFLILDKRLAPIVYVVSLAERENDGGKVEGVNFGSRSRMIRKRGISREANGVKGSGLALIRLQGIDIAVAGQNVGLQDLTLILGRIGESAQENSVFLFPVSLILPFVLPVTRGR